MTVHLERAFQEAADVLRFIRRAFAGKTFDGARYGTVSPDYEIVEDDIVELAYLWDDEDWLNDATATLIAAIGNDTYDEIDLIEGEPSYHHYGCEAEWHLQVTPHVKVKFYTANAEW